MKKRINARLPVAAALFMVAGVGIGYILNYYNANLLWLLAVIPFALAGAVFATVKKSVKAVIFTVLALILFFSGFLNCYLRMYNYSQSNVSTSQTYTVCGKVSEKGTTTYCDYIIISNATIDGERADGKIIAYLAGDIGDNCDIGYTVTFEATLTVQATYPYGNLNYNAEDNIKYSCNLTQEFEYEYHFSLFGSVRSAIRNTLFDNLSKDTAAVCFAMLTGNTQDIESGIIESFRYGGIAHIFAVSGLHIGIIFSVLTFIFKKFRLNKYISSAISLAVIVFYLGICGFTLSSVRAAIMCAVLSLSRILLQKYDSLNSLSVAVMIILFITPLSLFSAGFQLSVCAVGGIFMLSHNISKLLKKIKIPKKISGAAGTSFGAQLGTMPVMLSSFGYISGAGLLLNIIFIPLLSALFVIIFFCTIISACIPVLAQFVLPVATLPLELLMSFLTVTSFENALISGFGAGLFVPLYFIGILTISDKIRISAIPRIISIVTAAAVLTVYVLGETYLPLWGFRIIVYADSGGGEVIIKSSQGTVLIIYDGVTSSSVQSALNEYYALGLDGVIILGGEDCVLAFGELDIDCDDIYVCALYIDIQPYDTAEVHYVKDFTLCGVEFEFVDGYNLLAKTDNISVGISAGDINIESCDMLISKNQNYGECTTYCNVYFRISGQKYNIYEYGPLTFVAKDSSLTLLGLLRDVN